MARLPLRSPYRRAPRRLQIDHLERRELLSVTPIGDPTLPQAFVARGSSPLSSDLLSVGREYQRYLQTPFGDPTPFRSTDPAVWVQGDYIGIEASATGETAPLRAQLAGLGATELVSYGRRVAGLVPLDRLDELQALTNVISVWPGYAPKTRGGIAQTQGDALMRSDIARTQWGATGEGVTVGILSDSFNALGSADADAASGDIPPLNEIQILFDTSGQLGTFGTDEGRAMAQIIHDVAPAAKLAFHAAPFSEAGFANGVLRLIQEAGSDVVVDDIFYVREPFFQDGLIAQAADAANASGIVYVTSAGNDADASFVQQGFSGTRRFRRPVDGDDSEQIVGEGQDGVTIGPAEDGTRFEGGTLMTYFGADDLQAITIPDGGVIDFVLQWDQPFFSVSGAPAINDLDIYLLSEDGTTVIAGSNDEQVDIDGNPTFEDPIERLFFANDTGGDVVGQIVIVKRYSETTKTFFSSGPAVPIGEGQDALPGVSQINVQGLTGQVVSAKVKVTIDHPNINDLTVTLVAPDGDTEIALADALESGGADFINTLFDDAADQAIDTGLAPYTGSFRPSDELAGVAGLPARGLWTLRVEDGEGNGLTGSILDWSLELRTTDDPTSDPGYIKYLATAFSSAFPGEYFGGESTVVGHSNAKGAISVGAIPYLAGPGAGANPLIAEPFSSIGGTPIFFDGAGNRLPTAEDRNKPDLAAPDGVNTTFFPLGFLSDVDGDGFPNFFGTSAAAPHVAGVAALMLSAVSDAQPEEIRDAMTATTLPALDIIDYLAIQNGFTPTAIFKAGTAVGSGLIQADAAIGYLALKRLGSIGGLKFNDLDGDGDRDAGEPPLSGFEVFIDQNGNGVRDTVMVDIPANRSGFSVYEPQTVRSTLVVNGRPGKIVDVDVTVDIDHTADGDLDVVLISPKGKRIRLVQDIGGFNDNFRNTRFDDEASRGIGSGTAPFIGSFRPLESLSDLDGDTPDGLWALEVSDNRTSNIGSLNRWTLHLKYDEAGAVTDEQGHYVFEDLALGTYNVTDVVPTGWTSAPTPVVGNSPILLSEFDLGNVDGIEVQNVTDNPQSTAGWLVLFSDSPYSDINFVNPVVWELPDSMGRRRDLNAPGVHEVFAYPTTEPGGGLTSGFAYKYKVVYLLPDADGNFTRESEPSAPLTRTPTGAQNAMSLNQLPTDGSARRRIYRNTAAAPDVFHQIAELNGSQTSYLDLASDGAAVAGQVLDTGNIQYRTESPSLNYIGTNIFWNKNNTRIGTGWAMIVDDQGRPRDWVGWGWNVDEIQSFQIDTQVTLADGSVRNVAVDGLEGLWITSGPVTLDAAGAGTLQRRGNRDTNQPGDFRWIAQHSIGLENIGAGIEFPFEFFEPESAPATVSLRPGEQRDDVDFGNEFAGNAPRVIQQFPASDIDGPIDHLELVFPLAMDTGSFDPFADIASFTGPGGVNLLAELDPAQPFQWLDNNTKLRLNFLPQNTEGTYTLVLGPDVRSAAGVAMDQDEDGAPGELTQDQYTGTFTTASRVTGVVFNDLNSNGARDTGEPGIAGVTIYVDLDNDNVLDGSEPSAVTDADGAYSIGGLASGTITVAAVEIPGLVPTSPALGRQPVTLTSGLAQIVPNVNFGVGRNIVWAAQGPAPATGGQVAGLDQFNSPVNGAVHTVAAHPSDPDILYAGTVNGGVWMTLNARDEQPTWIPLTDEEESLSIGALEFDPTDASGETLVAGIGRFSSFSSDGGDRTGVLYTTDGGSNWRTLGATELRGKNISGIAARGNIVTVAVNSSTAGPAGIYRNGDINAIGGQFTLISGTGTGLPAGNVTDLVGDPGDPLRLYAAVLGVGIFRSDDAGANWTPLNFGPLDNLIDASTDNIEMAVHDSGGANALYIGVINSGELEGMFRWNSINNTWIVMDLPFTVDGGVTNGLHPEEEEERPGGQGFVHFSIVADPDNPFVVYVGGDRQPSPFPNSIGARNFTGRLFRGDASRPSGLDIQWRPITDNFASRTGPHADSREMVFDAFGDIIQADDGGVYRFQNPDLNSTMSMWVPIGGNLQIAEIHSGDYDSVGNVVTGGTQDIGTIEQVNAGEAIWRSVNQGDGGRVAIDDLNEFVSVRYTSSQFLGFAQRRSMTASNQAINVAFLDLIVQGTGGQRIDDIDDPQFYTPIETNKVLSGSLIIATETHVFESANGGDTLRDLGDLGGTIGGIAYGGRKSGVANPAVLYVGAGGDLYVRTTAGGTPEQRPAYPGGDPLDIVLDPNDWSTAYVLDNMGVHRTTDAGLTWETITGNLVDESLRTIEFVRTQDTALLLVGGNDGVFGLIPGGPGSVWFPIGAETLPNAPITDLHYDVRDDVLAAMTLGRGAWLANGFVESLKTAPDDTTQGAAAAPSLGVLSLGSQAQVDSSGGQAWYRFQAGETGPVSLSAAGGDALVRVYDSQMRLVATTRAGATASLNLRGGENYQLQVVGENQSLSIALGDAVERSGDAVVLHGTTGDDAFSFTAGEQLLVSLNGRSYTFDRADTARVVFHGGSGRDTAVLTGSADNDTAVLGPGRSVMSGAGYSVEVNGAEVVRAGGGGGFDTARIRDGAGDDQLVARPDQVQLAGGDYLLAARGFDLVRVQASAGNDAATLYDSAGDDQFVARPDSAQFSGDSFLHEVRGFDSVRALAGAGRDTAVLYDSAGDDRAAAQPDQAQLSGAGYSHTARGFDLVRVLASTGFDTASLLDSSGDDRLQGGPDGAKLSGAGYEQQFKGFDQVRASASGGRDTAQFNGTAGDEQLVFRPGAAQFWGDSFSYTAQGFDAVRADGGQGGDRATLYGSTNGDDSLHAGPGLVQLTGAGFSLSGSGFGEVRGFAGGGNSTALLHDSALDDHLTVAGKQVSLTSAEIGYWLFGFRRVTAQGTTGVNTREISATDLLFETQGDWLDG